MYLKSQEIYEAAIYLRLSDEDGDKTESDSIRNQRALIQDFVNQKSDLAVAEEYVDDGYSGTTFDRPGFQKMMMDIQTGKVNCIIVKDLSRFGRNYIEAGRYLEKIFPALGVRFIAVNDHIDTTNAAKDTEQIIIPFKNLINDAYCRDISIKVRSQLEIKRKNGKFTGSFAGYGYKKDPNDKNHLIIDEYAAEIVKQIFEMKLHGCSMEQIAGSLDEAGVLTPMEYKRSCGHNFNSGFRSGADPKWSVTTVRRILKNELYVGAIVQGKNRKINYKVKKSEAVDPKNWVVVQGMHEPIISREIFDCVQNLLKMDTKCSPRSGKVSLFTGLLFCGDCGSVMTRRSTRKKSGKEYFYYYCINARDTDTCTYHNINESKLYDVVLKSVQQQIKLLVQAERLIISIDGVSEKQFGVSGLNTQIKALNDEIEKYNNLKSQLYQDKVDGIIEFEEYKEISERFNYKINEAKEAISGLEEKKERLLSQHVEPQKWTEEFKKYRNIKTLGRKELVLLVKKIIVYSKEHIEIELNHADEIQEMLEYAEKLSEATEGRVQA